MLESAFPNLNRGGYRITSSATRRYNCIAWAAGDMGNWWWPVSDTRFHWPSAAAREETLTAFEAAFATLGYCRCDTDELVLAVEKVALFADANGIPTHAALQLENGHWTSKLGEAEDIEHELRDLEGDFYGSVVCLLRRPRSERDSAH